MPSLFERLGGLAERVIERSLDIGRSFADTISMLGERGIDVDAEESAVEWDTIESMLEREPAFADLQDWDTVPQELHETMPIPWQRQYGYKVRIVGRNLETGVVEHQDYNLPVSRQLTVAEAIQVAHERVGELGGTPRFEIYDAAVVGAYVREDVGW